MDERGRAAPVDPSLELDDATTREDLARCLRALKRRHARQNADTELTFRELAARSGYAYGAICQYFSGKVLPSTDRLEVLTALLGANGPEQGRFASVRDRAQEAARSRFTAADSAPLASPRHLPAGTRHFVGRSRELHALTASVGADGTDIPVFAIDGMAGVGKTALAVHVGHQLSPRFPDGQLYLELNTHSEGVPARTAYDALGIVLAALGMPPQAIPKDMDARIARYRERLADTRTLILLDDVADEAQVRPLLPGCTGCLVIVTSRKRLKALDDADVLSLDILPQAAAIALFRKTAGNERLPRDHELLAEVARQCGYLPLALRVVAAVFRHRRRWQLKDLLENLHGSQARLRPFDDGSRNVAAAFDLSYRYLTRELKTLFRRLGLVPGPDVDVFAAAAMADTDLEPTEDLLQDLVDLSLLTEPALGRYRLHDLLREHARAKSAQDDAETDRDAALDRLLDYYQHTAQAAATLIASVPPVYAPHVGHPPRHAPGLLDRDAADRWMHTELDNLCAAAQYAADRNPLHAITLPAAMAPYLYDHGPWSLAEALHRTASQIARGLNNPLARASALHDLGRVLYVTGELPAAADAHQLALEVFDQLDQRAGQAAALTELGRVHRLTSDHIAAITAFEQALELYRCIDQPAGEANALNHLGHVRQHAGNYPAAADAHLRALELYRRLGQLAGQAGALTNLGAVRHLTGDYPAAADALRHALKLYRRIDQPFGQAIALNNLGRLREVAGDYAGAADALEQSLQLYRRLGQPFGEAEALSNLGRIRRLTADLPAATAALERALELFRRIDQPIGQATALADLGTVRRLSGDLASAQHALHEALQIFRDTNSRGGEAWVLNLYAATFADAGDVSRALRIYRNALSVTREITQPDDEALALEGIGECLVLADQDQEGVEHLRQALALFQRLGMQPDARRVERRLSQLARAD